MDEKLLMKLFTLRENDFKNQTEFFKAFESSEDERKKTFDALVKDGFIGTEDQFIEIVGLGKSNGVVATDATVTPEPEASENMVLKSEDTSSDFTETIKTAQEFLSPSELLKYRAFENFRQVTPEQQLKIDEESLKFVTEDKQKSLKVRNPLYTGKDSGVSQFVEKLVPNEEWLKTENEAISRLLKQDTFKNVTSKEIRANPIFKPDVDKIMAEIKSEQLYQQQRNSNTEELVESVNDRQTFLEKAKDFSLGMLYYSLGSKFGKPDYEFKTEEQLELESLDKKISEGLDEKQKNELRYLNNANQIRSNIRTESEKLRSRQYTNQEDFDAANQLLKDLFQTDKEIYETQSKKFESLNKIIEKSQKVSSDLQAIERDYNLLPNLATNVQIAGIQLVSAPVELYDYLIYKPITALSQKLSGKDNVKTPVNNMIGELSMQQEEKGFIESFRDQKRKVVDQLRSGIAESKEFDDLQDGDDWGRYFAELLGSQSINTAILFSTGGAALPILAAQATAGSFEDMAETERQSLIEYETWKNSDERTRGEEPELIQYTPAQRYITAMGNGALEYYTERISLGIINRSKAAYKNLPGIKDGFVKGVVDIVKKTTPKGLAKNALIAAYDGASEAGQEGFVQLGSNMFDRHVLGKDVNLFDGVKDATFSGFVMANGVYKAPLLFNSISTLVQGPDATQKIGKARQQMREIEKTLLSEENLSMSKESRLELEKEHKRLLDQSTDAINKSLNLYGKMPKEIIEELGELERKEFQLRKQYQKIKDDAGILEGKENLLKSLNKEYTKIKVQQYKILGQYESDVAEGKRIALNIREIESEVKVVKDFIGKDNVIVFKTKEKFAEETGRPKNVDGYYDPNDGKIYINLTRAAEVNAITVGSHELLHRIMENTFSDKTKGTALVNRFIDVLKEKNPEAYAKVQERIDNNYRFERDDKGKFKLNKKGNKIEKDFSEYAEEYFNAFNDVAYTPSLGESLVNFGKDIIEFLSLKQIGFTNADFADSDGKDVYDFLIDYKRKFKKGKVSKKAKALSKESDKARKAFENVVSKDKKSITNVYTELQKIDEFEADFKPTEQSKRRKQELLEEVRKENIYEELRQIDEFEADFKPTEQSKNRKKELLDIINKEEQEEIVKFSKNEDASEEVQRLFNEKPRDWENLVIEQMRPITAKLVERRKDVAGFDREELLRDFEVGERGVFDLIRSYDPSKNDSLAAYINTFLSFRAQESSKRILKPQFEKDVTEEVGVAAQEDDVSIEEAVDESIKPTQEQKSKLRRQIRLPDEQVEKVRQAVRKTFGTKLPPPDSPKFKKALRKAFDTELFKELKTNVFKARDDYKFFMSQNWKALYDAIPQETLNQSFAPFREPVLDETGKQKREKTPEGERIFRKKNITKEEFLDYFFSPDLGVSTRGTRKDAIVRMAAQELGFDATMETIKEPKVAEKIEFANPEIKTPELSETIDRDQELQFSKESAENFAKNKYNFYEFKVDADYKKSVDRFVNDIEKLISLGVFPNSMLNKSMLNGLARLYFKGKKVKNKEAKKQYLTEKLDSLEKSFKEGSSNIEDISSYSAKGKAGGTFGTDLESEKWKNLTKDNGKAVKEFNQKRGDLFDTFWNSLNNFINDSSLTKEQRKKRIEDFGSTIYYILQASDAERSHPHSAGAKIVGFVKNLSESFRVNVENRDTKKIKKLLSITWEHAVPNKFAYESLLSAMYKGDKAFNKEFKKIKDNFTVIAIPKIVDKLLNQINKSGMPVDWNSWTDRYTIKELKEALKKAGIKFDFVEDIQPVEDQVISWSKSKEKSKEKSKADVKLNKEFNEIIANKTSIAASTTISDAKARLAGEKRKRFRFFIPPSADDLVGLLYYTLGKGKVGEAQLKWYNEHIISPFAQAMEAVSRDRNETARRFNKIVKDLGIIPKKLRKEIPGDVFTQEQAVRVYIWNKQGMKIPGLSSADKTKLLKYIDDNPKLKQFGNKVITVNRGYEYAKPGEGWLAGTITSDLKETLNTTKRAAYLQQWQRNVDTIFSKENLNKLEAAYGRQYRLAVENILQRMKTGRNRDFAGDKLTTRFVDWINGSVGAIMFFNTRSAILQTLSAVNFINFSDNNIFAAAKAFANQKQYWSDFKMLFNSDFLVDRRQGLRMDINEADLATAAKQGGTKGVISKLLKLGFTPTQIADSFAIAAGGSTFYRNRLNSLIKDGMDQKAAEKIAFQEFRETAEESQQSSRPDKISQQQAGPLGRIILAFANTPSQYARITKKAFLDLKNRRGDDKTNISKIVYYTLAQNLIFNAAQQALFAVAFSDEDDEEFKDKKVARVANGMADSVLRGLGFGGAIASTVKNIAIKLEQQSKKKNPEYQDAILDIVKISPPISSKITKLRSAARAYDWNKEEMKTEGVSINNPAALALGELTSAVTNVPLDRAIRKIQNVDASITDDLDFYQRLALLGGWNKWDLGISNKNKKNKKFRPVQSTGGSRLIIKIKDERDK